MGVHVMSEKKKREKKTKEQKVNLFYIL